MSIFVLTWDGIVKNLMVATSPSIEDAKATCDAARADKAIAIASADDIDLSGPVLAVLFNALLDIAIEGDNSENHVGRFATRPDGQRRVFALLEEKFKTAPEVAAPSSGDTAATTETQPNGDDDMATKAKKTKTKKTKAAKTPRVKKEKVAKAPKDVDDFGLRKGSKNAQAAAMFARDNGATMAAVKEKIGDTYYALLGRLTTEGHKVKKDGKTIFLTAKK